MTKRFPKTILSCIMAVALLVTSTAQAENTSEGQNEEVLGITDYAGDIKEVYSEMYPEQKDTISKIVDTVSADEEFIGIFESEGRAAFQIIEDALRDTLEPSPAPIMETDDAYMSKYLFKELVPFDSKYSDCATAVTVMALMGSNATGYEYKSNLSDDTTNKWQSDLVSDLYRGTSTSANINDITKVMRKKVPSRNNYNYVTKVVTDTKSNYSSLFNILEYCLIEDFIPIIKVENPQKLSYRSSGSSQPQYMVIRDIDFNAETVTLIDSNNKRELKPDFESCLYIISYEEFESLITSSDTLWMSVACKDKSAEAIEALKAEYPHGSYFTNNGKACERHTSGTCSNCKKYDGGWQCAGFARYAFHLVKGRYESSCENNSIYRKSINQKITAVDAQKYLQGLSVGTYVRVGCSNIIDQSKNGHSITIIDTSDTGITFGQANYSLTCMVTYVSYSWTEFVNKFPVMYFYVE